ncbi:MAG: hypothetical protein IJT94_15890 [Oscillibacter sp.]|nr:hypothetical protein [Oscillibacter sp.]
MPPVEKINLNDFPSLCGINQRTVKSVDNRNPSYYHLGRNPGREKEVRQYRPDGQLVPAGQKPKKCDFLVINDTDRRAYFIELKGSQSNIDVRQMAEAVKLCGDCLKGYRFLYRFAAGTGNGSYSKAYVEWRDRQPKGTVIVKRGILEEDL